MKTYSDEFKAQVVNAVLNEGMSIKQAVRFYNLSRDSVRQWVRLAQGTIQPLYKRQKISEDKKKEAVSRVLAGERRMQVAREFGVSYRSVYIWGIEYENEFLKKEIETLKAKISAFEEGSTV